VSLIRRFYAKALSIMVLHVITPPHATQGQMGKNTLPAPKMHDRNLMMRNICRVFPA
jgi:hypothetical protein